MRKQWIRWVVGAVVAVIVVIVAAPFVYIHFIESDPPPKLELSSAPPTTTPGTTATETRKPLAGVWNVDRTSTAGYRVDEVLFGQDNTAVGRTTSGVTGEMTISGTTVTKGSFTVDLTTVTSDRTQRDNQFQGRIMDTAQFPNATFTLTSPIKLGSEPKDGEKISVTATGNLTLHGQTKSVTVELEARRTGNIIEVSGSIPVKFDDYQIPSPSRGGISVQDHGSLEFLLQLRPAST